MRRPPEPEELSVDEDRPRTRAPLSTISNEMVRVYRDHFGRGPSQTRTDWAGNDTIVVVLENTLTTSERKLAELGEHQRVREARLQLQHLAIEQFCEPVERVTGRKVRAFLSSVDIEAGGAATEVFLLHPPGHEGPSRLELGG